MPITSFDYDRKELIDRELNYMPNLLQTLSNWEHLWQRKNIVFWAIGLSAVSLVFYLFYSGPMQGIERPLWYRITTYILQDLALIGSGLLCLRNGVSERMPSGSNVWVLMGIALFAFLIGNLFFCMWELIWHLDPVGSLGDPFFVIFYICLSLGMVLAIASKRIQLKLYQWFLVAGITLYAAAIATWIMTPPPISIDSTSPAVVTIGSTSAGFTTTENTPDIDAPAWVKSTDLAFKPYGQKLSRFYVWCDVALFGLAIAMILAFWGGRLSNAWQVNAQAIICFYIADMWLAYGTNHIAGYQSGFMLEVFWVFGIVQFGVAAALEFEHMLNRQKLGVSILNTNK
jgi:hypothetical protein